MFFCINLKKKSGGCTWHTFYSQHTIYNLHFVNAEGLPFLFELKNERNTPHQPTRHDRKKNSYNILNLQNLGQYQLIVVVYAS